MSLEGRTLVDVEALEAGTASKATYYRLRKGEPLIALGSHQGGGGGGGGGRGGGGRFKFCIRGTPTARRREQKRRTQTTHGATQHRRERQQLTKEKDVTEKKVIAMAKTQR